MSHALIAQCHVALLHVKHIPFGITCTVFITQYNIIIIVLLYNDNNGI